MGTSRIARVDATTAEVRRWAQLQGYPVGDTGNVSNQIKALYEADMKRLRDRETRAPLRRGLDG